MASTYKLAHASTTTSPAGKVSARRRKWSRYSSRTFYLFVSPWVLGFFGLTIGPMVYALLVSFTDFSGFGSWHWVGLANYLAAFHDSDVWLSLQHTLLYMLIIVPTSIVGGLGLALLVNRPMRSIGLFRALLYLPSIVPIVAATIIWKTILNHDTGPLNAIIDFFPGGHDVNWFGDTTILASVVILVLWGIGSGMIISLAGLQGIPQELREAAQLDGASAWHSLLSVTLPLLSPVLFFEMVLGVIGALQVLVQPLLLDGTALQNSSRSDYFYMVNVYLQFFSYYRYGYGAALLWILFALIVLFTLLVFRSSSFWVYYEVER